MSLRVLIAPLDWGLGHAARCIPVVRSLQHAGHEVVVAAQGAPAHLLATEFPTVRVVPVINYAIRYGRSRMGLYARFPGMVARVVYCAAVERRQAARIVRRERIGCIVSDNRFGFRVPGVHSVYITHQFTVKFPRGWGWLENAVWAGHGTAIRRFDEVWVPDLPGEGNLTGELTHLRPLPRNCRFVGPLSRFAGLTPRPFVKTHSTFS